MKRICCPVLLALVVGFQLPIVEVHEAMAQTCTLTGGQLGGSCPPMTGPNGINGGTIDCTGTMNSCAGSNPVPYTCTDAAGQNVRYCMGPSSVPEMSDYLAVLFIVAAGGMIYHFRRRASA
jgi:hypothetical protein